MTVIRGRMTAWLVVLTVLGLAACSRVSTAREQPTAGQHGWTSRPPTVLTVTPTSGTEDPSPVPIVRSLQKSPYGNAWFSPDGNSWLANADGEDGGIAIATVGDATAKTIIPNAVSAAWGPDSRTLAITTSPGPLSSETETLPLFIVQSDGSGMRQIGETDAARYIQYLGDGEVAFQYKGDLHVVQPQTGADEVVAQLASDPTIDVPFVFSPDGGAACLVRENSPPGSPLSLNVLSRSSHVETVLSNAVDIRSWQPCAWSPDGAFLAFADQTEDRSPMLHLYDRKTGEVKDLLHGPTDVRAFGGLSWMPGSDWLAFDVDPGGTEFESGAVYEAINVNSGDVVELFRRGLGLRLSPDGHWIGFARTEGDPDEIGYWLAELSFSGSTGTEESLPTAAAGNGQNVLRDGALGIEFTYPDSWTAGTPWTPYASCFGCLVVGRAGATHPYGIEVFAGPLDKGCGATCYVGNGALPLGEDRRIEAAGREGSHVEIKRMPPAGLTNTTGETTPYREIWTLVPMEDQALLIVAFYRSDDATAEGEVKAAYEDALSSLALLSSSNH